MEKTDRGGWRLFSVHSTGLRHRRMAELLSAMEANEASGETTSPGDVPGLSYRLFYSAVRNGFARVLLVPRAGGVSFGRKAYVATEKGREWLDGHRRHMEEANAPRPEREPRPRRRRKCVGMTPISQIDSLKRKRHREAVAKARERMLERKAAKGLKEGRR